MVINSCSGRDIMADMGTDKLGFNKSFDNIKLLWKLKWMKISECINNEAVARSRLQDGRVGSA